MRKNKLDQAVGLKVSITFKDGETHIGVLHYCTTTTYMIDGYKWSFLPNSVKELKIIQ